MAQIFESERLVLRELTTSDAEDFFKLNANPEVLKYTGDSAFLNLEEAALFLENYSEYRRNGFGRWAVILKESGRFLGWCGLKRNEENLVDLGFRFFQEDWGKGYATEAARASLHIGFEKFGLEEIIARASSENKASIRVLEKLAMQYWKKGSVEGIENAVYYRIGKSHYNK